VNQKLNAFFSPSAIHGAHLLISYFHYLGAYDLPDPSPLQQLADAQAEFANLRLNWVSGGKVYHEDVPLDLECPLAYFHHELRASNQAPYQNLYVVRVRADWARQLAQRLAEGAARTGTAQFGKVGRYRSARDVYRLSAVLEVGHL
jgi:hypothetical protein